MAPRQDYCKTCGLFTPCPDCGGKARPVLSVVASPPKCACGPFANSGHHHVTCPANPCTGEPRYTADQIRAAFERAWSQCDEGGAVTADDVIALLVGGS